MTQPLLSYLLTYTRSRLTPVASTTRPLEGSPYGHSFMVTLYYPNVLIPHVGPGLEGLWCQRLRCHSIIKNRYVTPSPPAHVRTVNSTRRIYRGGPFFRPNQRKSVFRNAFAVNHLIAKLTIKCSSAEETKLQKLRVY